MKDGYPHQTTLVWGIPLSGRPLPPRLMFAFHNVLPPMNYNTILLHTLGMPVDAARNYFAEQAVAYGLSTREELASIAQAWRRWAGHPDAILILLHGEVIARP